MVKKELLKAISLRIAELCEAHGISSNLEVKNFCDDECDVRIPKDIANTMRDKVTALKEDLEKMPEIKSIYDKGLTRNVLRGDEFRELQISVRDGQWTHGEEDELAADDHCREYFDQEYHEQMEKKRAESRKNHWRDYLIPLPRPDGSKNTELYLTMCYEPYDWIESGDKDTEFRSYNEYYAKKLLSHPIKTVKFQRGYGGPGRPKPKQMIFAVKSITLWDSVHKMECDPRNPTPGIVPTYFAINLGKRLDLKL